jgi:hypothetical protein
MPVSCLILSAVLALEPAPAPPSPGGVSKPVAAAAAGPVPLRLVNKRQVRLCFDVRQMGPSGLGGVELHVTTDEGHTWERMPLQPEAVTLPPLNEAQGAGPACGSVLVNLPQDGVIYGFYLVGKSGAGLSGSPPQSGALPQIRVEADTVMPDAELYRPHFDPADPGVLLLTWRASDRNLSTDPVTLEWSESLQSGWTFIGPPAHPNTGRFSWKIPAEAPARVYLRLTVRDAAGNVSVVETPAPLSLDLKVPKITITECVTAN